MTKAFSIAVLVLLACLSRGTAAQAERPDLEEGIVQYRAENVEEALVLLQKSREQDPASSLAAFYLGLARKQSGDIGGAIKDLTDAATLKPPVLDAYLELADACHTNGDDAKALEWVNRSQEARVRPGRTLFMKGIVLAAQGRSEEALGAFGQAKQLDVTLTQPADFQSAMIMASSRKLSGARDALRAVIAADPNSEIGSYAKEYEQSFTRLIDSQRSLHLTLGLNYLYDDNAISNPSNAAAQAQIGNPTGQRDHAFLGTLRLDYTPILTGNTIFSAQYLLQCTKYGNGDNPSTLINSVTLIPGYAFGNSALSLPVNYSHVLLMEQRYQQLFSARPTWSWQVAPRQIVQGALTYNRREMLTQPLVAEENRDGNIWGGSAGHIFSFGDQGGMTSLRYDYSYDAAQGSNWSNHGHRVSLNAVVPLTATVRVNLSGEVFLQRYLNTNNIFGIRRDDTTWFGTAGVSWNLSPNVVLAAQYAHTTADSNIPVYGYNRNTFSTGVEVSF